jgi:hypothetical protein
MASAGVVTLPLAGFILAFVTRSAMAVLDTDIICCQLTNATSVMDRG